MALLDILLGQRPEDVRLSPEQEEAARQRRGLASILMGQATGTEPTSGEEAVRLAGEQAAASAGRRARAQAAGAGGFGNVIAGIQAGQTSAQAAQGIAGETAAAAGRQRSADVSGARSQLLQTLSEVERSQAAADEERRRRARPGILGPLATLAGAGIGSLAGNTAAGAQIGGTLGQSFTRR